MLNKSILAGVCLFSAITPLAAEPVAALSPPAPPQIPDGAVLVSETTKVMTPEAAANAMNSAPKSLASIPVRHIEEITPKAVATQDDEAERARLRSLPAYPFKFKDATLADAVRTACEVGKIKFYIPPALDKSVWAQKVTIKGDVKPGDMLELLCDTYGVTSDTKGGIRRFYAINIGELVPLTFKLHFTDLAVSKLTPQDINSGLNTGGAGGGQQVQQVNSNATTIDNKTDDLLNALKEILARPTTGLHVPDAGAAPGFASSLPAVNVVGTVRYNPDNTTLEVFATRQQGEYIRRYLASVDVPPQIIQIDAEFVEVATGENLNLGLDTSGVSQISGKISNISTTMDFRNLNNTPVPHSAVGSISDLSATLNTAKTRPNSSVIQSPTATTLNNRKVLLGSTDLNPILSANNSLTAGVGQSSTATISYLNIGLHEEVLALILDASKEYGGKRAVRLDTTITVSSQTGTTTIQGNPYPVVNQRTFAFTTVIPEGCGAAIAGLRYKKVVDERSYTWLGLIPGIDEIPWIGYNTKQTATDMNLMGFLVPRIMDASDFDPSARSTKFPKKDAAEKAAQGETGIFGVTWDDDRNKVLLPPISETPRANTSVPGALSSPSAGAEVPEAGVQAPSPSAGDKWDTVRYRPANATSDSGALDLASTRTKLEQTLREDPDNASAKALLEEVKRQQAESAGK